MLGCTVLISGVLIRSSKASLSSTSRLPSEVMRTVSLRVLPEISASQPKASPSLMSATLCGLSS